MTGPSVDEVREESDHFGYAVLTGTDPEPDTTVGIADLEPRARLRVGGIGRAHSTRVSRPGAIPDGGRSRMIEPGTN